MESAQYDQFSCLLVPMALRVRAPSARGELHYYFCNTITNYFMRTHSRNARLDMFYVKFNELLFSPDSGEKNVKMS